MIRTLGLVDFAGKCYKYVSSVKTRSIVQRNQVLLGYGGLKFSAKHQRSLDYARDNGDSLDAGGMGASQNQFLPVSYRL